MTIRPSIATLPHTKPQNIETVFDYLLERFSHVRREVWERRFQEGKVLGPEGPLDIRAVFQPRLRVRYFREPEHEFPVRNDYSILDEDDDFLVADKPWFLPVTPSGNYAKNCLLEMLIQETNNAELAPLHRIDKDTAGIVVFSKRAATRSHFARLFRPENAPRYFVREYLAACQVSPCEFPEKIRLEHHIARNPDDFCRQVILPDQPPNAMCHVEKIQESPEKSKRTLARIRIETGKKHQIRVQLSAIGAPVVNDRLYGANPHYDPEDLTNPMRLLCQRIAIAGYSAPDGRGIIDREWISRRELNEGGS